jgi:2-phosphosulfolactate phosphatase
MFFDQHAFDIRCEWGNVGISQLAPNSDAIIIVDVLSFSTSVDIAVANGAIVYPYRWQDESALEYARAHGAILAHGRRRAANGYTLSPKSLMQIPTGTRLVLPSRNGSTLSIATAGVPTFTACLRNAKAVAYAVQALGTRISVIPAGERWGDGSLRPAFEDLLGAGAIIHYLQGTRSPEAVAAEAVFVRLQMHVAEHLQECSSGVELIGQGFADDVALAAKLNQSDTVPILRDGAYVRYQP